MSIVHKLNMNLIYPTRPLPKLLSILAAVVMIDGTNLATSTRAADTPEAIEFFENKIRPVLVESCYQCHSAQSGESEGGLLLDSRAGLRAGGDTGPVVVLGKADESKLLSRIAASDDDQRMPPADFGKPLPPETIADFRHWISQGAADPRDDAKLPPAKDMQAAREHWACQVLRKPAVPQTADELAVRTPLDSFVFAKQAELGIVANPPTDRRSLLRRVTYDLTGLPPTYEQVLAFENDTSVDAYEKVVERLLESTTYGQRWGRFWLDVARYADTKGYLPGGAQLRYPFSYTYRDYVIDAFNLDKPFQQFIVEQIAADHLDLGEDRSALAALGYLTLGRRFLNNQDDIIDDRIDVVARGMLGLTVGCARCHDHKFDPIPTADYYSWHGVFASSREPDELPLLGKLPDEAKHAEYLEACAKIEAKIQAKKDELIDAFLQRHQAREDEYATAANEFKQLGDQANIDTFAGERKLSAPFLRRWVDAVHDPAHPNREEVANWIRREINEKSAGMKRELEALSWTHDGAPQRAMALVDADRPHDSRILLRGKRGNNGEVVPRQFLEALSLDGRQPFQSGSGRLELAEAIASQPLTARVFVNRVWGWHFGQPLVDTPSDFGVRTAAPVLVDALEWLAADFMEHGGSIKHLHRQIVLSSIYQQSSQSNERGYQADPENLSLYRFPRRRLEFEAMRDTLLLAAGTLDTSLGGLPIELTDSPAPTRRSVYGFIDRQNLPGVFRTFDFPNPDATTPSRFRTTVPQQALYLMNSRFVAEQSDKLAAQIASQTPAAGVEYLYQRLFQRLPTPSELELGTGFLADASAERRFRYCQSLLLTNELLFVD
ncbi:MAG: PSD1 and planctomycete cytochrome C domain-containing protein [Pirellulaceae bacterium]